MQIYVMKKVKWKIKPNATRPFVRYSWVEEPAMEGGILFFSKIPKPEQQIVYAPLIVANKEIPRVDEKGNMYEGVFDDSTIKKLQIAYSKSKTQNSTLHHNDAMPINGDYLFEIWTTENQFDKAYTVLGFSLKDVPVGSLMGGWHIENKQLWEKIKAGEIKGPSFEFVEFEEEILNFNKSKMKVNFKKAIEAFTKHLYESTEDKKEEMKEEKKEYASMKLAEGDVEIHAAAFEVGQIVYADAEMSQALEPGDYLLENGMLLVVGEGGAIASMGEMVEQLAAEFSKVAAEMVKATEQKFSKQVADLQKEIAELKNKAVASSTKKNFSTEKTPEGNLKKHEQLLYAHRQLFNKKNK